MQTFIPNLPPGKEQYPISLVILDPPTGAFRSTLDWDKERWSTEHFTTMFSLLVNAPDVADKFVVAIYCTPEMKEDIRAAAASVKGTARGNLDKLQVRPLGVPSKIFFIDHGHMFIMPSAAHFHNGNQACIELAHVH